ncbi:MAG: PKD domain-containing protein [Chitinophagaceae bacterium]
MKKYLSIIGFLLCCCFSLHAMHIRGGEMFYLYTGPGSTPGTSAYTLTLKLYVSCGAQPSQLDGSEPFSIYSKSTGALYKNLSAPLTSEKNISYDPASNPCISNPPSDVCYRLRYYSISVELPDDAKGYTIAFQRCCRIAGINNLTAPSDTYGATYSCEIPGTDVLPLPEHNSSPEITGNDAVAVCVSAPFTFDFSGNDPDKKDSLVYHLCAAYNGGGQANGKCYTCSTPDPAAPPPYAELPYTGSYAGTQPLGIKVSINSQTGLLSGVAPNTIGQYVVTVCIYEYRNQVLINVHRKDIHIGVSDCIPLKAQLNPSYDYCDDFLVTFKNEQVNPSGSMYIWNYGDNTKSDTSMDSEGRVQHQYADTGVYTVKLTVILAGQCIDSTTTLAKVFPGFYPGFVIQGTCMLLPIQFVDTTKAKYGVASKWSWTFGDETTLADTSHIAAPSWKYSTVGNKTVQLIVESNKGCIDTVTATAIVTDKPPITLPFSDTLICSIDTLTLHAQGNGVFSWLPNYNILNANTADPQVYPKTTTDYVVTLNENGCVNQDTVTVRVIDFVTLSAGPDSTICLTDTVQLRPSGNGLYFAWTPIVTLNDASVKSPKASPTGTTTYTVTASIGKCKATDDVTIFTVPYPAVNAGPDTAVCYGDTARLHATIVGSSFTWSPTSTLSNPNSLITSSFTRTTISYILKAYDNLGCPKPGIDTVVITVYPKITAFAGNDTSVVINQPLQLNGTGANLFDWQPPLYLNRNDIKDPIALLNDNFTYVMKAYTAEGCFAYDTINIKVFKTNPDIFVPNAFKPGGSQNNVLRPIPVGISKLEYFRVFNRWGQLVFETNQVSKGWDGTLGGKLQASAGYVWSARAVDYTGKVIERRGTAVLIR